MANTKENNNELTHKPCDHQHKCCKKRKRKQKHDSSQEIYDHNIFECPLLKATKEDLVQCVYPGFLTQCAVKGSGKTNFNYIANNDSAEDKFFDCSGGEGDSQISMQQNERNNIAEVLNNIQDPKEFKCLLKEVAQTSHILYRCFKRAYHKAKKTQRMDKSSRKPVRNCKQCLGDKKETQKKSETIKEIHCEHPNLCYFPFKVTDIMLDENGHEVKCDNAACECLKGPNEMGLGGEQLDIAYQPNSCDCLEKYKRLMQSEAEPKLDSIPNLCSNYDKAYEGLSFCERCAKLRGEPITCKEQSNNNSMIVKTDFNSPNCLCKQSALDSIEICPCMEFEANQEDGKPTVLVKDIHSEVASSADKGLIELPSNISSTTKHLDSPLLSSKRSNMISPSPMVQSPHVPSICLCPQLGTFYPLNQTMPSKDLNTICSYFKADSNPVNPKNCCCFQQQTPSNRCQCLGCHHSQPRTYYHLGPMQTCHASKNLSHPSRPSSKTDKEKSRRKLHQSIQMEPISFILPINFQLKTRNGETHLLQTQVGMEAYAEPEKRKHRHLKASKKPLKPNTITAANCTSQTQSHFEQQTQAGGYSFSSDVYYSCSSSSILETKNIASGKPCESLVEIFDMIKNRVRKSKTVSRQVLKTMVSYDLKKCLGNGKLKPAVGEREETPVEEKRLPIEMPATAERNNFNKLNKPNEATVLNEVIATTMPLVMEGPTSTAKIVKPEISARLHAASPTEPKHDSLLLEKDSKYPKEDPHHLTLRIDSTEVMTISGPTIIPISIKTQMSSKVPPETKFDSVKFAIDPKSASEDPDQLLFIKALEGPTSTQTIMKPQTPPEPPPAPTSKGKIVVLDPITSIETTKIVSKQIKDDADHLPTEPTAMDKPIVIHTPIKPSSPPAKLNSDTARDKAKPQIHRTPPVQPLSKYITRKIDDIEELQGYQRYDLTPDTEMVPLIAPTKVSGGVQTDMTSSQATAHFKRNEMRREIRENLEALIEPSTSSTANKYDAEEIDEILRDLYTIFNPNKEGTVPKDESRESILEDIRLMLNPSEMHKTVTTNSKSEIKKSPSKENKLKDIGHILNPKTSKKPTKHYTKEQREQMLDNLQKLLKPLREKIPGTPETRDSVLLEMQLLLDKESVDAQAPTSSSRRKTPTLTKEMRDSAVEGIKYLLQIQDVQHVSQQLPEGLRKLPRPQRPVSRSAKKMTGSVAELSTDDEVSEHQAKKSGPPTPKKPNRQKSLHQQGNKSNDDDENYRRTHEVDQPEQIPLSQIRNQIVRIVARDADGISLVSTSSSDTFFINIDENLPGEYTRTSMLQRRSRFFAGNDRSSLNENPHIFMHLRKSQKTSKNPMAVKVFRKPLKNNTQFQNAPFKYKYIHRNSSDCLVLNLLESERPLQKPLMKRNENLRQNQLTREARGCSGAIPLLLNLNSNANINQTTQSAQCRNRESLRFPLYGRQVPFIFEGHPKNMFENMNQKFPIALSAKSSRGAVLRL